MSDFGSILGSLAGGAIGSAVAPGLGTTVGSKLGGMIGGSIGKNKGAPGSSSGSSSFTPQAGLSLGTGIMQQIQANRLKNKADASVPELVDPNQSAFLAELGQKRKSIETGADFAAGMNAIDATNAGTNEAITRNTGGDVGGTIQALLQSQRAAGDSKNQVIAQGQQQQNQVSAAYQGMLDKIAARRLQLQMYNSQQARAEWAKKQQQASQNLMAGAGRMLSSSMTDLAPSASAASSTAPGTSSYSPGKFVDTSVLNKLSNQPVLDDASQQPTGQVA